MAVWDGEGADNYWSTPQNWVGDVLPRPTDAVTFDTTSTRDAVVDIHVTARSLLVQQGYTGTISFGDRALVVSQEHVVADGTVRYGTAAHQVGQTMRVAGGLVELQSATLTMGELLDQTGGTFDLGTATVIVAKDATCTGGTLYAASATIRLSGSTDQGVGFGDAARLGTVQVEKTGGVLTFQNGFTASTLAVSPGDAIKFLATKTFAVTHLHLSGTAAEPITLDSTERWTSWGLNLAPSGSQQVSHVSVRHSDASAGARVNATDHVTDAGFNVYWDFGTAPALVHATANPGEPSLVYLRYGEAMDPATAADPAHYSFSDPDLAVRWASISTDRKLVSLGLAGVVVPGTTAVTAAPTIQSLVGRNLPATTQTVVAGDLNGIPDTVGAVRLSLSTDDNYSVIQDNTVVALTVTAPGTDPMTVGIGQVREPAGSSVVYLGDAGTATSATVTTSGGSPNQAWVLVRHAAAGRFLNDITLRAYAAAGEAQTAEERGSKLATGVRLTATSEAYELVNQNKDEVTIQSDPIVEGLRTVTSTVLVAPFSMAENPTTVLAYQQFAPLNASGQASIPVEPHGIGGFTWGHIMTAGAVAGPGTMIDHKDTPPVYTCDTGPKGGPGTKTQNSIASCCPCAKTTAMGGSVTTSGMTMASVDPSDGEKKLDLRDLVIPGRGELDYEFRRVYQSFDYRSQLGIKDFGVGWRYSYADDYLLKDGTGADEVANYINYREGPGYTFVMTSPGNWEAALQHFVQLRKNPFTGDFEIRDESGLVRVYHNFSDLATPNRNGRLKEIRDRNDNRMTFQYERIDPDGRAGSGDEKFVLASAIDALGRRILYYYHAATNQTVGGRPITLATANRAAWGRLARVRDFKGNMDFNGSAESQDFPGQVNNRALTFDYDEEGNLTRASAPAIGGTPNGNNFAGKTTRYQYITNANRGGLTPAQWNALTPAQRARLLHKVTHIWYPNEVRNNASTNPPPAEAAEVLVYETDPSNAFFGFVVAYTVGGTNAHGVPAGGTVEYQHSYVDRLFGVVRVQVTDRNGNRSEYTWAQRSLVEFRELTRGFRAVEPADYVMMHSFSRHRILSERTLPEGNRTEWTFNDTVADRFQHSNITRSVRTPGPRGGDQAQIETVYVYEPIYNRPCLIVSGRGTDASFARPVADPAARLMPDPYDPTRMLNVAFARVEFFDFQESREKAREAPDARRDIDGSGGRVNQSPLIAVDGGVLTTEVWLVQELGLPETAAGLNELRNRLGSNLTRLGLGDLNGDGDTTPAVAGNIVRTTQGSPVLLVGSNQHRLESDIESAGDLVNQALAYDQGGTAEGAHGGRLQTIVTMHQYNRFGQPTKTISPEGNVTAHHYFAEIDPDGDTVNTPPPADGRSLAGDTGGYLEQTVTDETRSYFDQNGTPRTGTFSNNHTNPAVTQLTVSFRYDDVGNVMRMRDGRGIDTDFFVNEHNQVVQTRRAAGVSGAATANPSDPLFNHPDPTVRLTAFGYLSRSYFDYNGRAVLSQMEDRGNTSLADGNGLSTIPVQAVLTTPGLHPTNGGDPAGGTAFVDTLSLYDRLNNRIETRVEVSSTHFLQTRYRYDGNQHLVLTVYPEGNADSAVFDERDLLFQSTRGADTRPAAGRDAPDDPRRFIRPGGTGTQPSTMTYNYDKNENLIEVVDAEDNGGAKSLIHPIGPGAGDVTRITLDGYDRRKTVTDPLGNKTLLTYDPDSNVVRTIQEGEPVNDVAGDTGNRTLAVTEYIHDELSRVVATHRVLFQTPYPAGQGLQRTPTLTDTPAMDALAAYLADAANDTAAVPGAVGITVIGRVTTLTEYDRESRVTFAVQDDLDAYRTDYDGAARVIKTIDSALSNGFSGGVFDPAALRGNMVEIAYDDNNNPIERKETDVTLIPSVVDEVFRTTSLYDSLNRLQTIADNRGQTDDYRYDSRNNLVAKADAVGPVTGRVLQRRGLGSTAAIVVNTFGNVTRNFYDGINRTLQTEVMLRASGQGNGTYVGATLVGAKVAPPTGYVDRNLSEDGFIKVHYAWDDNSQLLALRDDDGNTTGYLYDNQNRTLAERKGMNAGFQGTTFCITGGDCGAFREPRTPPDPLRDPPVETEAGNINNGTTSDNAYDRDSNVVRMVNEGDVNGVRSTINTSFDALNRKKELRVNNPPGSRFVGTTLQRFTFDGLSRLTECFDNNEPGTTADDVLVKHFYDSLSRLVEEQQKIGALTAKAVSYHFDIGVSGGVSQASSLIYPDGRQLNSTFDRLDRLVNRSDQGQMTFIGEYKYIGTWRVATLTFQNRTRLTHIGQVSGQNADVGYDNLRRMVNHRWESFTPTTPLGTGTLIVGFGHQRADGSPAYDRANNKLIEEKLHDPDNSEVYTYDSAYRLKTFDRGTLNAAKTAIMTQTTTPGALQEQTWNLDGVGNWTSNTHTTGGVRRTENRTSSDFNEIVVVSGSPYGGGVTGTHVLDKNGNLVNDGVRAYQWDALNRLRRVTRNPDGEHGVDYLYDCNNRRFRKDVFGGGVFMDAPNGPTDFYYDDWRVVEERGAGDAITQQYVYGNYLDEVWTLDNRRGGITVAQLNDGMGGERLFYHGNTLYHVYGLTDETGALKEGYQYDAYGRATVLSGPGPDGIWFTGDEPQAAFSAINNSYTYTGQRLDTETGLMYYKNRYYVSGLGRFLSRDPIGYQSGVNLYQYAQSNPVAHTDPTGQAALIAVLLVVSGVVLVGGAAAAALSAGCNPGDTAVATYQLDCYRLCVKTKCWAITSALGFDVYKVWGTFQASRREVCVETWYGGTKWSPLGGWTQTTWCNAGLCNPGDTDKGKFLVYE